MTSPKSKHEKLPLRNLAPSKLTETKSTVTKPNERPCGSRHRAPRKQPKGEDVQLAPLNQQESANKSLANKNVVSASADSADAGGARTAIAIETSKSDWRLLAQEAIAAMQAELENSPNQTDSQKLAIESKIRMMNLVIDDLDGAMTPIEFLEPKRARLLRQSDAGSPLVHRSFR